MFPNRVGVPNKMASASASWFGSITGMCAKAYCAAFAPLFSRAASGTSSGT